MIFIEAGRITSGPPFFLAGTAMLRSLLLLLPLSLSLVACVPLSPARTVVNQITADEFWSGRVVIDGDVVIAENALVRIAPGTEILFLPPSPGRDRLTEHPHFVGSELIVQGRIIAEGTATAPILFRFIDRDAPAGSWGGINLVESNGSLFRHCRFIQADSAIHSQESVVDVSCSIFDRNRVGVRFFDSPITIADNIFRDNGTAIRFHFGAPVVERNLLTENDRGIFVTAYPRDYRFVDNSIVGSREAQVVLGEEVPDDLLLSGNYWGSSNLEEIRKHFFDGEQSDYLGRVMVDPYLLAPLPNPETRCNP